MNHRVFIAINLPPQIREKLYATRDQFPDLPCRWTKKENLHLTLVFLGSVGDQDITQICQSCQDIASKQAPFNLELNLVCYGPPKKFPPRPPKFLDLKFWRPRMVWAIGRKSPELAKLKNDLEKSLFENVQAQDNDNYGFSPHITLGRLKTWQLKQMEKEEIPEINEEISLSFPVESIEVMESELKKQGPEYSVLQSIPLGL